MDDNRVFLVKGGRYLNDELNSIFLSIAADNSGGVHTVATFRLVLVK